MTAATDNAKAFNDLMKKLGSASPEAQPDADNPIAVLIMSMLMWESTTSKALAAFAKLKSAMVDFNELRVCLPQELAEHIGLRYPAALERCQRLRASLNDIFRREHDVKLDHLRSTGKRDVKKYMDSLDGIVPYASARVQLMCFDTHAVPADEQLRKLLVAAGVVEDSLDVAEVGQWLARVVKSGEGLAVHHALQQWVDTGKPVISKAAGKGSARSSRKRTAPEGSARRSSARVSSRSSQ